ncbi:MAG: dGTPase [Algoriphagus marincola HL-49]|uniref:dGTPase n=1 Tax=Algoriphagus marincola HL-49 TaxID=1305737 RepID=A0A0P7YE18_9BACT|nr:MAG: dGTPase [Algoriphagus marincola HL-49]
MKLDWNKLITAKRFGASTYHLKTDARTEFERDLDRIIFSSPFRRLKDKTQVFPVPKSDFVHNRLTHSIEVSSIGRSIGKLAGEFILKKEGEIYDNEGNELITATTIGHIVAAACLAHDIGNPPFGHSGEQSFRVFFKKFFAQRDNEDFLNELSQKERRDFLEFEGNAEGFRILTNDHPSGQQGGLKLTYSTLGAFTKYPKESIIENLNSRGELTPKRRSKKKVGFFQSERSIFEEIANDLGLIRLSDSDRYWCRHPLSFLVEAADNITYTLMDIEDGHKLKLIQTEDVVNLLKPIANSLPDDPCPIEEFDRIENEDERVGAYRAKAINALIFQAEKAFEDNYDGIMSGTYDSELTESIRSKEDFEKISDRTNKFFQNEKVVEIEFAGMHVVSGLLSIYLDAYRNIEEKYAKNLIGNLPKQFQFDSSTRKYDVLLKISTFISRMTDNYALDFYRKLTGHKLPEII